MGKGFLEDVTFKPSLFEGCVGVGQADRSGKGCPGRGSQPLTRMEFVSLEGQQEDRMGSPESKEESGRSEARGEISQATLIYPYKNFGHYLLSHGELLENFK